MYGVLDQMAAAAMNPQLAELVAAHPNLVRCGQAGCWGGLLVGIQRMLLKQSDGRCLTSGTADPTIRAL